MQSIKFDALTALKRDIEGLAEAMKERRRELHEELAEEMQEEVAGQIARRASHSTGDLAGWQEPHVGSAGGYAAVRRGARAAKSPRQSTPRQVWRAAPAAFGTDCPQMFIGYITKTRSWYYLPNLGMLGYSIA